jgi:hypothetical protein
LRFSDKSFVNFEQETGSFFPKFLIGETALTICIKGKNGLRPLRFDSLENGKTEPQKAQIKW